MCEFEIKLKLAEERLKNIVKTQEQRIERSAKGLNKIEPFADEDQPHLFIAVLIIILALFGLSSFSAK